MADESKIPPKKGSITEEGAAALLERYPVETVLTLLQEVERVASGDKIDWEELVKKTATGISCAREYQMLWRHLAYGRALGDQSDSDADDDSDLEYDLEASPAATEGESALAAACVKVLIASGSNDSHELPDDSIIDAPLTINIRSSSNAPTASSDASLVASTYVTVPVSVQKSTGGLTPCRKKRRPDWANTAKGDFENGLPKRWTSLSKKPHTSKVGSSSQLSETELAAAREALPVDNSLSVANQIKTNSSIETSPHDKEPQVQPFNAPASQTDNKFGITGPPISQVPKETPPMKCTSVANSIKDAAFAAGARIGTSTEVSSFMEAARSQNVVRLKAAADVVMRKYRASRYQLPSYVCSIRGGRSIRGGLAKAPGSSYSAPVHSAARAVQPDPVGAGSVLSVSSEKTNSTASIPSNSPISAPVEQVPHNQLSGSKESGYHACFSSCDSENNALDAHVGVQISEDEELEGEGVEATSSNSIAPTDDDE